MFGSGPWKALASPAQTRLILLCYRAGGRYAENSLSGCCLKQNVKVLLKREEKERVTLFSVAAGR